MLGKRRTEEGLRSPKLFLLNRICHRSNGLFDIQSATALKTGRCGCSDSLWRGDQESQSESEGTECHGLRQFARARKVERDAGSSTQMDTKPTYSRKSLQRDVLKRKKMAASRAGEAKFARWKVGGERRQGAFWHARCTYPGIGPRTRRFPGEMVQSSAGETTPAARDDCWTWMIAAVRIDSPNR